MNIKTISSVISPVFIKTLLLSSYNINKIVNCELLQSNINDIYKVETLNKNYIFKFYNTSKSLFEINFEISFVSYLKSKNIGVAQYIKKIDRDFILKIDTSEGLRYGVLIEFIEGKEPNYKIQDNAFLYGKNVAELHQVSKKFLPNGKIKEIEIYFLLNKSIQSIESFLQKYYKNELSYFKKLFIFLLQKVKNIEFNVLEKVYCHGDLHGGNVLKNLEQFIFFDFDFSGCGFTSYDISVFRWGCIVGKRESAWQNFIKGYKSIRKLNDMDLTYSLIFVLIRDLFIMSLYINRTKTMGTLFINKYYIQNRIKFLQNIESKL